MHASPPLPAMPLPAGLPAGMLESRDILDLAVLGAAADAALPVAALPVILREIGGDAMTPTAEVVAGRVGDLAGRGLLAEAPTLGAGPWAVATTAAGRHHVRTLLQRPGPPVDSPLGAVTDRLRLCLLDLLEADERAAVLAQLETVRQERLRRLRRAELHCPCRHAFMRRWLAHETDRLDAELGWIHRLAQDGGGADVAPPAIAAPPAQPAYRG